MFMVMVVRFAQILPRHFDFACSLNSKFILSSKVQKASHYMVNPPITSQTWDAKMDLETVLSS